MNTLLLSTSHFHFIIVISIVSKCLVCSAFSRILILRSPFTNFLWCRSLVRHWIPFPNLNRRWSWVGAGQDDFRHRAIPYVGPDARCQYQWSTRFFRRVAFKLLVVRMKYKRTVIQGEDLLSWIQKSNSSSMLIILWRGILNDPIDFGKLAIKLLTVSVTIMTLCNIEL